VKHQYDFSGYVKRDRDLVSVGLLMPLVFCSPKKKATRKRNKSSDVTAPLSSFSSATLGDTAEDDDDDDFADDGKIMASPLEDSRKRQEMILFVESLDVGLLDKFHAFWHQLSHQQYLKYQREWKIMYPYMRSFVMLRSHSASHVTPRSVFDTSDPAFNKCLDLTDLVTSFDLNQFRLFHIFWAGLLLSQYTSGAADWVRSYPLLRQVAWDRAQYHLNQNRHTTHLPPQSSSASVSTNTTTATSATNTPMSAPSHSPSNVLSTPALALGVQPRLPQSRPSHASFSSPSSSSSSSSVFLAPSSSTPSAQLSLPSMTSLFDIPQTSHDYLGTSPPLLPQKAPTAATWTDYSSLTPL
jgi:hypothetical protein